MSIHKEEAENFSLKTIRKMKNISQQELAKIINRSQSEIEVNQSEISSYERMAAVPTDKKKKLICKALGTTNIDWNAEAKKETIIITNIKENEKFSIKDIRTFRGMTQLQLSIKTGIAQGEISFIERKIYPCTTKEIEKIAKALQVDVKNIKVKIDERREENKIKKLNYDTASKRLIIQNKKLIKEKKELLEKVRYLQNITKEILSRPLKRKVLK